MRPAACPLWNPYVLTGIPVIEDFREQGALDLLAVLPVVMP
jgi:hypothetical protein